MRLLSFLIALFSLQAAPAMAAGFASPSGNITCYVDIYSAAAFDDVDMVCLIGAANWDMPPYRGDQSCDLDSTRAVILPRSGPARAVGICHGDVFWPAPLGAISYGSEWSLSHYTCTMDTDGVRCTTDQGHGFHVSRSTRDLY